MSRYFTFHLTIQGQRATASLDVLLAQFVAVSMGVGPFSPAAHGAVRDWTANSLASWSAFDPALPLSGLVRKLALRQILDKQLAERAEQYGVF